MRVLLAVDIGNTNITLGVFDGDNLLETARLVSDYKLSQIEYERYLREVLKTFSITDCALCSVVDELTDVIKNACDKVFGLESFVLTSKSNHGLEIALPHPETLGADRIANAIVIKSEKKFPAIVVDIGTATTFDILDKEGAYIGGLIMPGLNIQLKALNLCTSKLPEVKADFSPITIATNTENAILSGVVRGAASAIEGLISQCESELGQKMTIIATGGQLGLVEKYMFRKFDFVEPNLTLRGVKFAYEQEIVL